jgi:hypothetical protein
MGAYPPQYTEPSAVAPDVSVNGPHAHGAHGSSKQIAFFVRNPSCFREYGIITMLTVASGATALGSVYCGGYAPILAVSLLASLFRKLTHYRTIGDVR